MKNNYPEYEQRRSKTKEIRRSMTEKKKNGKIDAPKKKRVGKIPVSW